MTTMYQSNLFFILPLLFSCQTRSFEDGAASQNNGPLVPKESSISGASPLIIRLKAPTQKALTKCVSSTNFKNFNVWFQQIEKAGCEIEGHCSGVLVLDPRISAKAFTLTSRHCFSLIDVGLDPNKGKELARSMVVVFPNKGVAIGAVTALSKVDEPFDPDAVSTAKVNNDIATISLDLKYFKGTLPETLRPAAIDWETPKLPPLAQPIQDELERLNGRWIDEDFTAQMSFAFPLEAFAKFPKTVLAGYGLLNQFLTKKTLPTGETGTERTIVAGNLEELRSITMNLALLDATRKFAFYIPTAKVPSSGTCQGDSGGPGFSNFNETAKKPTVFSLESEGTLPCQGSWTRRTWIAKHADFLASVAKYF